MSTRFVSFDPGKKALGWAIYQESLRRCGILRPPKNFMGSPATLGLIYGHALREEVRRMGLSFSCSFTVVHEHMRVYDIRQQKGDPNDLIFLSVLAGAVAGRLGPHKNEVDAFAPSDWKGQLSKEQVVERLLGSDVYEPLLDPAELQVVESDLSSVPASLRHNALEAVAIGLRKLNRFRLAKGRGVIAGSGLGRPTR